MAYIAYAGLTPADVVDVKFPNYRSHSKSVIEGKANITTFSATSAAAYEMATHPKGLVYLEFDPNNKEAIARMQKFAPFMTIAYETTGAGLSKDKSIWTPYYRYPMVVVRTDASAEYVYDLIKKLDECYPLYKNAYPPNSLWAIEQAGIPPADAPFHEGAIKYLKEKGVWKPEHDKWNNKLTARLNKIKELWDDCLDTIDKMDEKERKQLTRGKKFTTFWLDFKKKGLGE
ncbi:TAXI family TRAP transporter solute-binding subunit [Thermodesulfobacteriota bacterium]